MGTQRLDYFREVITSAFPDLISSTFKLITVSWHSTAIDVDDHLIFKFPRYKVAQGALVKEAALLAVAGQRRGYCHSQKSIS
jgi:hypothetical protein